MKLTTFATTFAALFASLAQLGTAEACTAPPSDFIIDDVSLRPGVSSDIHVIVESNPRPGCNLSSSAVLAIHGATGTASTWTPFARELFESRRDGRPVCRFISIDLPGHGESSLPQGMLFGDLTLGDYVTAIVATLDRLEDHGIRPTTIIGHSQGGMLVQLLQKELLSQGSSLREEFGIKHAVLMASAPPAAIPWAFPQSSSAGLLAQFVGFSPTLGLHVDFPDPVWLGFVFGNLSGELPPNAPTAADADLYGYRSPEPFNALGELLGMLPSGRPDVEQGIFAHSLGTDLDVVAFASDPIIRPEEAKAHYTYLTGRSANETVVVPGTYTSHAAYLSDPKGVVSALHGRVSLP